MGSCVVAFVSSASDAEKGVSGMLLRARRPTCARIFQECMLCLAICLVVAALSHGDGVVALLRVEVSVPGVSSAPGLPHSIRDAARCAWLDASCDSVQDEAASHCPHYSLVLAPDVDGVAGEEGESEVGNLLGDALDAPEDVAVEGTLHRLLREGRDGCWGNRAGGRVESRAQ